MTFMIHSCLRGSSDEPQPAMARLEHPVNSRPFVGRHHRLSGEKSSQLHLLVRKRPRVAPRVETAIAPSAVPCISMALTSGSGAGTLQTANCTRCLPGRPYPTAAPDRIARRCLCPNPTGSYMLCAASLGAFRARIAPRLANKKPAFEPENAPGIGLQSPPVFPRDRVETGWTSVESARITCRTSLSARQCAVARLQLLKRRTFSTANGSLVGEV